MKYFRSEEKKTPEVDALIKRNEEKIEDLLNSISKKLDPNATDLTSTRIDLIITELRNIYFYLAEIKYAKENKIAFNKQLVLEKEQGKEHTFSPDLSSQVTQIHTLMGKATPEQQKKQTEESLKKKEINEFTNHFYFARLLRKYKKRSDMALGSFFEELGKTEPDLTKATQIIARKMEEMRLWGEFKESQKKESAVKSEEKKENVAVTVTSPMISLGPQKTPTQKKSLETQPLTPSTKSETAPAVEATQSPKNDYSNMPQTKEQLENIVTAKTVQQQVQESKSTPSNYEEIKIPQKASDESATVNVTPEQKTDKQQNYDVMPNANTKLEIGATAPLPQPIDKKDYTSVPPTPTQVSPTVTNVPSKGELVQPQTQSTEEINSALSKLMENPNIPRIIDSLISARDFFQHYLTSDQRGIFDHYEMSVTANMKKTPLQSLKEDFKLFNDQQIAKEFLEKLKALQTGNEASKRDMIKFLSEKHLLDPITIKTPVLNAVQKSWTEFKLASQKKQPEVAQPSPLATDASAVNKNATQPISTPATSATKTDVPVQTNQNSSPTAANLESKKPVVSNSAEQTDSTSKAQPSPGVTPIQQVITNVTPKPEKSASEPLSVNSAPLQTTTVHTSVTSTKDKQVIPEKKQTEVKSAIKSTAKAKQSGHFEFIQPIDMLPLLYSLKDFFHVYGSDEKTRLAFNSHMREKYKKGRNPLVQVNLEFNRLYQDTYKYTPNESYSEFEKLLTAVKPNDAALTDFLKSINIFFLSANTQDIDLLRNDWNEFKKLQLESISNSKSKDIPNATPSKDSVASKTGVATEQKLPEAKKPETTQSHPATVQPKTDIQPIQTNVPPTVPNVASTMKPTTATLNIPTQPSKEQGNTVTQASATQQKPITQSTTNTSIQTPNATPSTQAPAQKMKETKSEQDKNFISKASYPTSPTFFQTYEPKKIPRKTAVHGDDYTLVAHTFNSKTTLNYEMQGKGLSDKSHRLDNLAELVRRAHVNGVFADSVDVRGTKEEVEDTLKLIYLLDVGYEMKPLNITIIDSNQSKNYNFEKASGVDWKKLGLSDPTLNWSKDPNLDNALQKTAKEDYKEKFVGTPPTDSKILSMEYK